MKKKMAVSLCGSVKSGKKKLNKKDGIKNQAVRWGRKKSVIGRMIKWRVYLFSPFRLDQVFPTSLGFLYPSSTLQTLPSNNNNKESWELNHGNKNNLHYHPSTQATTTTAGKKRKKETDTC